MRCVRIEGAPFEAACNFRGETAQVLYTISRSHGVFCRGSEKSVRVKDRRQSVRLVAERDMSLPRAFHTLQVFLSQDSLNLIVGGRIYELMNV